VKGEFEIFARESGVDVSIGKAKTAKGAAKKLSKKLKKHNSSIWIHRKSRRKIISKGNRINKRRILE